jgi:NAD(P)-dependent dehydrogenase (short-subunit alcohol dehydrogenase family)
VSANRFTGRRALVTGAASGIRAAVARKLHAEGADVVLADVRAEPVEAIAAELDERAHAVQLDVRDEEAVRGVAREADVLANVAGIGSTTNAPETPLAVWEDVFAVPASRWRGFARASRWGGSGARTRSRSRSSTWRRRTRRS